MCAHRRGGGLVGIAGGHGCVAPAHGTCALERGDRFWRSAERCAIWVPDCSPKVVFRRGENKMRNFAACGIWLRSEGAGLRVLQGRRVSWCH
eukprot:2307902-Prymnesium_polylepis.1